MDSEQNATSIADARDALERAEAAEYGLTPAELGMARRSGMDPRRYAAIKGVPTTRRNVRAIGDIQAAISAVSDPTDQEAA